MIGLALALLLAPAASFVAPGRHYVPGLVQNRLTAALTRRYILEGLKDLGRVASGETSSEELSLGPENEKLLAACQARVARINAMEPEIEKLKDAELRAKTKEFRARLAAGETLDDLLEEAFAVVREAAWRVLELRHYDVQLVGGMVLAAGRLAEMATGEGKTLAATLPTYLAALEGRGALVVTANEYLARRDAETVGQVYRFLGLKVGLIQAPLLEPERKEAYACDVTYATNSELGFDFLRDNLALSPDAVVMPLQGSGKEPTYCLVDECDSILVDEARTPLIISKQVAAPADRYEIAASLAEVLAEGRDYEVDLKGQSVTMTEKGFARTEALLEKPLFDPSDPWAPFLMNALKAKALFEKDTQYIVRDPQAAAGGERGERSVGEEGDEGDEGGEGKAEVCIVDTFSGRVMDGRRWSDGLHQSIEAKEGLAVSTESQVIATVTYQALFRRYPALCGMSGTALADASEFNRVYNLRVTPVPTALPVARRDYADVVYRTGAAKQRAVVKEVLRQASSGRPVLVGTTSVAASEELAEALRAKMGDQAEGRLAVLNARPDNVDKEGEVVSAAGRLGAVTVATNMAGRGTDILLGGNPGLMAKLRVREGLASTLEAGVKPMRPMDPGFYPVAALSAEAEAAVAAAAEALLEDGAFEDALELDEVVSIAAERAPVRDPAVLAVRAAYRAVKAEFAAALAPEKEAVRKLGGLYVVGTERHESARIDGQLRGRAGRQGDPGASRFFLALDDQMLRTFGADRMGSVLDAFRVSEDTPLEAPMVGDAVDKVQAKVEEYYAGIRAQVFTFDEVLDVQRNAFYGKRAALLGADDAAVEAALAAFARDTVRDIVPNYCGGGGGGKQPPEEGAGGEGGVDGAGLAAKVSEFFPGVAPLDGGALSTLAGEAEVLRVVETAVTDALAAKKAALDEVRPRQLARVGQYLALVQWDNNWSEHLKRMNYLKESVVMRKYMGRDPLQEYVAEGAELFTEFLDTSRRNTVFSLFAYQAQPPAASTPQQ